MKFPAFEPIDLKNKFELYDLPLDQVFPDPNQPRKNFTAESLQELSDSIKRYGLVQPIVVREIQTEKYLIIAGERRWRASRIADLKIIPAIIKSDNGEDDAAIALVENIQRESLNPIELAEAFLKLSNDHSLSHDEIAKIVGKSRAAVTNTLRLLNLSADVKKYLTDEKLEMGHARSLLSLSPEQQVLFAKKIISENLTVRDAERVIRNSNLKSTTGEFVVNPYLNQARVLESELSNFLNSKVSVKINRHGSGQVLISLNSIEKIKWIIDKIREVENV